jgi:hypothetical protein
VRRTARHAEIDIVGALTTQREAKWLPARKVKLSPQNVAGEFLATNGPPVGRRQPIRIEKKRQQGDHRGASLFPTPQVEEYTQSFFGAIRQADGSARVQEMVGGTA